MQAEDLRNLSWRTVTDYERDLSARYFGDYVVLASAERRGIDGNMCGSFTIVTLVYKSDIEKYVTDKTNLIAQKCKISFDVVQQIIFEKNTKFFSNLNRFFPNNETGYSKESEKVKLLMRDLSLPDLSIFDCLEMFRNMNEEERNLFMREMKNIVK